MYNGQRTVSIKQPQAVIGGKKGTAMFATVQTWVGRAARPFSRARYDALAHERVRFYTLLGIALLKLFNLFGSIWDIQWHASIGRDSLWIPPHMVAAGGFVSA